MTLSLRHDVDLQPYNTLAISAKAACFVAVENTDELLLALALAKAQNLAVTILGGGSNIVLRGDVPGLVIHIANKGHYVKAEDEHTLLVSVAAGELWDDWVRQSLDAGYYGLENLSLIPGTVGAAPVQNIGAYGVEVGDRIEQVQLVFLATGERQLIRKIDCQFGYRDSLFKQGLAGKVAITEVTFRLFKKPQLQVTYPALQDALLNTPLETLTPQDISNTVRRIRASKLPDPALVPNAGSFFKNPVVATAQATQLRLRYPDMPIYPINRHQVKIPAAWLIDHAGWKGAQRGAVGVHHSQALVLTNTGRGSGGELLALAQEIAENIHALYGIALEREPVVVPGWEDDVKV